MTIAAFIAGFLFGGGAMCVWVAAHIERVDTDDWQPGKGEGHNADFIGGREE